MPIPTAPPSATAPRLLVSVEDALAALGGISRATFYRLVGAGRLPSVRVAGRRFVRRIDLEAYVDSLSE
jgi:excisionase family DNA binding protein